jgi:hypothetical protein
MELLKELQGAGFGITAATPQVHCRVYEDNSGALEIAREYKFRPRTKHINVKLHHFRDYVDRKEISFNPISTRDQTADILTKPLEPTLFIKHRMAFMGW